MLIESPAKIVLHLTMSVELRFGQKEEQTSNVKQILSEFFLEKNRKIHRKNPEKFGLPVEHRSYNRVFKISFTLYS